ncbi:MAG: hypothetical protein K5867_05235 [Bacteroidales bacterium]|nr:hypothetical protein [Bacteroidales bacterium]
MKKIFFIAAASMLLLSMTSCNKQKDGVFNPKQKISAIYHAYREQGSWYNSATYMWEDEDPYVTPMHKSEEWVWDGKQLQQIRYFSEDGTIDDTETFTYDGKQLVRVEYDYGDDREYTTYEYDGKELASAKFYVDGLLYISYEFTHTDKKITDITMTEYDYDKSVTDIARRQLSSLRSILPMGQIGEKVIANCEARLKTKAASTYITRISLTWTSNNITRITYKWSDGDIDTDDFTYDNKKNPYYGLLNSEGEITPFYSSENNVLTYGSYAYVYEYDRNDYPTSRVSTYTYTYSSDTHRVRSTSTNTYEYLK